MICHDSHTDGAWAVVSSGMEPFFRHGSVLSIRLRSVLPAAGLLPEQRNPFPRVTRPRFAAARVSRARSRPCAGSRRTGALVPSVFRRCFFAPSRIGRGSGPAEAVSFLLPYTTTGFPRSSFFKNFFWTFGNKARLSILPTGGRPQAQPPSGAGAAISGLGRNTVLIPAVVDGNRFQSPDSATVRRSRGIRFCLDGAPPLSPRPTSRGPAYRGPRGLRRQCWVPDQVRDDN